MGPRRELRSPVPTVAPIRRHAASSALPFVCVAGPRLALIGRTPQGFAPGMAGETLLEPAHRPPNLGSGCLPCPRRRAGLPMGRDRSGSGHLVNAVPRQPARPRQPEAIRARQRRVRRARPHHQPR